MKIIFDALNNIKKEMGKYIKGDIVLEYQTDTVFAIIMHPRCDSVSVSAPIPYDLLLKEIGQKRVAEYLYHQYRFILEKNFFTWYDT